MPPRCVILHSTLALCNQRSLTSNKAAPVLTYTDVTTCTAIPKSLQHSPQSNLPFIQNCKKKKQCHKMCLLKMCLCGFICVCLNDFVFLFFASSIWVKCWQQLPVSLLFYPLIQQEVAVCCSYIVFTGVASVLCTPTGEGWGMQTTTAQRCHSLLHRSPLSLLTGCNLGIKAAFFPCFSTSPKVTLYSWPGYASLGKEERASLTPLHWPKPSLVVGHGWSSRPAVSPTQKCKNQVWHVTPFLHISNTSAQLENWKRRKRFEDDVWGKNWEAPMRNRVPLTNNPPIWELKVEV